MRLIVLFAVISLAGCASGKFYQNINVGMTMDDVRSEMGKPKDRSFRGNSEAWQYCKTGFGAHAFATVWFEEGLVTGLTSDRSTQSGTFCSGILPSVDWGQMPKPELNINIKNAN